jgi:hypothetical protein
MMFAMITCRLHPILIPLAFLACQSDDSISRQVAIPPVLRANSGGVAEEGTQQNARRSQETSTSKAAIPQARHSDADGRFSEALVPKSAMGDDNRSSFSKKNGKYQARVGSGKSAFTWVANPQPANYFDMVVIESGKAVIAPMHGSTVEGMGETPIVVSTRVEGGSLVVTFKDGVSTRLTAIGKSLKMEVSRSPGPRRGMASIDLGGVRGIKGVKSTSAFRVPYFDISSVATVRIDREVPHFLTAWFDSGFTNASTLVAQHTGDIGPDGELRYSGMARYLSSDRGQRRTVQERVWITWSSEITDVLPSMSRPALEDRASLSDHYYLSYSCTPFSDATANINTLAGLGVKNLHVWMKHWQKDGFDTGYPNDVMPPRRQWGGLDGILELREATGAAGYALGFHHNWMFNSEKLPGKSMLTGMGKPLTVKGGGAYLKTSAALELLDEVENEIHDTFQTQGTYTDSLAASLPNVDLDSSTEGWGLLRTSLADLTEVLQRLSGIHGAPIASEGSLGGGNVTWAGLAHVMPGAMHITSSPKGRDKSGKNVEVIPHFALGRIHEISIRAGIGQPTRFFMPSRPSMLQSYAVEDRDLYQTLTALYGNAGFYWWYGSTRPGTCARDWWSGMALFHELSQPGREVLDIMYVDDRGREYTFSEWVQKDGSLKIGDVRLHLTWKGGDELWANVSDQVWNPKGRSEAIAPYGHLAHAGAVTSSLLSTKTGIVETLESPTRRFLDGRGVLSTGLGITTDGAVGLERIAKMEGGGWQVFPIPVYTLGVPGKGSESIVELSVVNLDESIVGNGEVTLTWCNAQGEEGATEVRPAGAISLSIYDFTSRDATSVRVVPTL